MSERIHAEHFREMRESEIEEACQLVARSMNSDEAQWAEKTMRFHFGCLKNELDDGRRYFTYQSNDNIIALVGLHQYEWGPEENVWLSWFAVDPSCQRMGIGASLVDLIEKKAKGFGYTKLFIETYSGSDFDAARKFYKACGFTHAGSISGYLSESLDMLVYKKELK